MCKEELERLDYWLAKNVLRWQITIAEMRRPINCPIVIKGDLGCLKMTAWKPTRDFQQTMLVLGNVPHKFRLRLAFIICKVVKEVMEE